jgi:hypothetical protein
MAAHGTSRMGTILFGIAVLPTVAEGRGVGVGIATVAAIKGHLTDRDELQCSSFSLVASVSMPVNMRNITGTNGCIRK